MSTGIDETAAAVDVAVEQRSLVRPFRFAHGTLESVDIVRLRLTVPGEDRPGNGEVGLDVGYGEDGAMVANQAHALATSLVERGVGGDVHGLRAALAAVETRVCGPARMLVEMAFLDHAAWRAGVPVWQLVGLPAPGRVQLLHTVAIGEDIPSGRRPVKVKLGFDEDDAVLRSLIGVPGPILLDVNRGWRRAEWTRLAGLVTQVAPAVLEDPTAEADLLPEIMAALPDTRVLLDEDVNVFGDVVEAARVAGGANIKAMRLGGLFGAQIALEHLAGRDRARMLGCFLEPPRAVAYAAQLAGLCDWTDLDGHFWLEDTPAVMSYRLDSSKPGIPTISYQAAP